MTCKRCIERGKPSNFGSDPKCAFESGVFSSDNWQCATMNALRQKCIHDARIDDESIGYIHIPDSVDVHGFYLVLTWYKSRGQTGNALIMGDDYPAIPLTLEVAEQILEA